MRFWNNKSIDILFFIKRSDGTADSYKIKKKLDMEDNEFYPLIRTLMAEGFVVRKKAFIGRDWYVKHVYFLTEQGLKYIADRSGKEIQIQG
jgi:DNA-binding PadR family transcriptional regulator